MINQINTNKNVFAPLKSNGVTYAITKPFTPAQKAGATEEEEKKSNAFGYGIAITALVTGFGVFAVMKGLPKNARHSVNKFLRLVDDKASELSKDKQKNIFKKVYIIALKGAKELTKRSKTIFNAAPLKDAAVTHWLAKSPKLQGWSDRITDLFERISVKTSKRAYSKSLIKFETMFAEFDKANKTLSKAQTDVVEAKTALVRKKYIEAFSETARNRRLVEAKNDMKDIDKAVYNETYGNLRGFTNKAKNGTFISEELASDAKIKLNNTVNKLKEEITISPNDNFIATRKLLNNIYNFVDQSEETPRAIMNSLKKSLKQYKKALENGAKAEEAFPESAVAGKLEELKTYFEKSEHYNKKATKEVTSYINNLNSILTTNKKGELQNIMEIYKANLPQAEFQKLNHTVNKTLRSLDKSIDLETDKLFDKVRDLLIGAAPVDVLGVISSLGVIGWGLSKAENKDERISAALKFGIPALGAVIVSLICTVGLIAGGPSLIIGLVSGAVINKLGVVVDDVRKKYNNKQQILPDPMKILPKLRDKAINAK